ncbi:MAG: DUF5723 family protein [Siphonobacter sp.]
MKKVFFFIFFINSSVISSAQYLLGQSSSNYAGIHGVYLNPAQVADSRYKLQIHLAGYENYLYNNYLVWNAPYSIVGVMTNTVSNKYRNIHGAILFDDETYLREKLNGRTKHLRAGAEVRGPGLLYTINDKHSIALGTRVRAGISLTNTSESVARILRHGTTQPELIQAEDFGNKLNINSNGMAELSGTYGRVLLDNEDEFWKIGITIKRLIGLHNGHLLAKNIDYEFVNDPLVVDKNNILLNNISAQYGITDEGSYRNFRFTPAWLLGRAAAGAGWGADLGMVYEYRPDALKYSYREKGQQKRDASQNKYLYRISISLLDIGRVHYRNPAYVYAYNVQRQNLLVDEDYFDNVKGVDGMKYAINQTLGVSDDERVYSYHALLPTSLQASIDYHLKDKIYVNALLLHCITSSNKIAFTSPSVLALTPRYENKWIEVAVPVSLTDNYSRLALGVGVRLGLLYFGSDNILSTFNIGSPKGMEFYFGLQVPIFRKPPESSLLCYPKPVKKGIFGFLKKDRY